MDDHGLRKTFKDKLHPPPPQARAMETVLWRCRDLYHAGREERREAWRKRQVSVTEAMPSAQLPRSKAVRPECAEVHSPVLQDVLKRLDRAVQDRAVQAFFLRVKAGETPGYPRFQGRDRYQSFYKSFTYQQFGHGASRDTGLLVLSKSGRVAVRWSRPVEGAPKTVTVSREADGGYVCCSCAEIPLRPLPLTGEETGRDVGLDSYLTTSDGEHIENPRSSRQGEMRLQRCQRRVSRRKKGSKRRRKALALLKTRSPAGGTPAPGPRSQNRAASCAAL